MFERAQAIIANRSVRVSDDEMLQRLRDVLDQRGCLSGLIIDEVEGCPSSSSFRTRFGSLLRAYALVGFAPDHDYSYLEINRRLRQRHPLIVASAIAGIESVGGYVVQDTDSDLLTINREFTASIIIVRCYQTEAGSLCWKLRLDTELKPDITVAIRMDDANSNEKDYYLLPRLDMRDAVLRLCEYNGLSLDAYRFGSLAPFYQMTKRTNLRDAA